MLRTFKIGGIHPPENKVSASSKIEALPLPEIAYIPLGQHIGAPATAIVAKGDKVKVGQLIAKASGFVSANIHASVSGTVTGIESIVDGSGYPRPTVVIAVEGDEWAAECRCHMHQARVIADDKICHGDEIDGLGQRRSPTKIMWCRATESNDVFTNGPVFC